MEIKNAIGLKEVYKLYLKCRRIQRLYTDKEESLHNDPMLKGVINLLVKQFNIANIIETGTYLGFTTKYFKLNYPNVNVTSIEKDERTFVKASNNLKDLDILVYNLDSREVLSFLKPFNPLFFLDAHWNDNPLNDELNEIAKLKQAIIIIDDFKVDGYQSDPGIDLDHIKLSKDNKYHILIPNYKPVLSQNLVGYCIIFQNINISKLKKHYFIKQHFKEIK